MSTIWPVRVYMESILLNTLLKNVTGLLYYWDQEGMSEANLLALAEDETRDPPSDPVFVDHEAPSGHLRMGMCDMTRS